MTPFEPALPLAPLPDSVTADIPCRKCGYNLRSLRVDGNCPECGTPVIVSVRGDLLRYSDPGWIRLLSRGMSLILWGIVSLILALIVMVIAGIALRANVGSIVLIMQIVSLAAYAMMVAGSWLITAPDPSGVGEDQYGRVRKIIRITLIVGVGKSLIDLGVRPEMLSPALYQLFQIVGVLCAIVSIVGLYAQLQYLQSLSRRIPNEPMARRAAYLKQYFVGSYAALMVVGLVMVLINGRGAPAVPTAPVAFLGCFVGILALVVLVFGFIYLRLIENMHKQLKEQVTLADQNWAGHADGLTLPPVGQVSPPAGPIPSPPE